MTLAEYKIWFEAEYKHPPGMKCIESFLHLHPLPDPTPEEFFAEPEPVLPKFKLVRRDES